MGNRASALLFCPDTRKPEREKQEPGYSDSIFYSTFYQEGEERHCVECKEQVV